MYDFVGCQGSAMTETRRFETRWTRGREDDDMNLLCGKSHKEPSSDECQDEWTVVCA